MPSVAVVLRSPISAELNINEETIDSAGGTTCQEILRQRTASSRSRGRLTELRPRRACQDRHLARPRPFAFGLASWISIVSGTSRRRSIVAMFATWEELSMLHPCRSSGWANARTYPIQVYDGTD